MHKRLLFHPNLPFKKVGTVGEFWEQGKSKAKLWEDIQNIEKRISEGLAKPNLKELCQHISLEFFKSSESLKQIERSYGYFADTKAVQDWIDELKQTEWADGNGDK
jgi:hypothetical protein